jgi:hypothetical protein
MRIFLNTDTNAIKAHHAMPLQLIATSERPTINFSLRGRLTVTYLLGEWVAFSADGLGGCMAFSAGWLSVWHFQLVGWLCGIFC